MALNLVDLVSAESDGRKTYFLNDKATANKLKMAANNVNIKIEQNSQSSNILFSTGSYMATVVPLINDWKEIEGGLLLAPADGFGLRPRPSANAFFCPSGKKRSFHQLGPLGRVGQ